MGSIMAEKQPTLRDFVARLKDAGRTCTQLGVGPVSEIVMRATFQAAANYDCPPVFIASRNQVDLEELGHGYLMGGMDQKAFVETLSRIGREAGYEGPVYICRDHGGPWQRNVELDEKYPVDRAMEIARASFRADIEAGFNYLHIDPTKCPVPFTQQELVGWTVDLERYCEAVRKELGKGPIDYEVGTEDIQGGLTTADTFASFLKALTDRLNAEGLPLPTCVVGQTGTLCRIDRNCGTFDREGTARLAQIAAQCGVGLKEHNGDYLSAASCRVHPELGVTGMNVAPEFGLVETDACLGLADLEEKLVREGLVADEESSRLRALFLARTFDQSPWPKWMLDDVKKLPRAAVEQNETLRLLIARVCGHYVYDDPEVKAARERMYKNLDRFEMIDGGAKNRIVARVRDAIEFYYEHFRLRGVNDTGR